MIFEFLSVIIFIGISKITFAGNCKYLDDPVGSYQGYICAGAGGIFFISVSTLIMVFYPFYWVFYCVTYSAGTTPRPIPPVLPSIPIVNNDYIVNRDQENLVPDKIGIPD